MHTGLEFIPLTILIGIVGWFAWAALTGSRTLFIEKKFFAALCALLLATVWLSAVAILISQVYIAWMIVAVASGSIIAYKALDDKKRRILNSLFGWCCIIFVCVALWMSFSQ